MKASGAAEDCLTNEPGKTVAQKLSAKGVSAAARNLFDVTVCPGTITLDGMPAEHAVCGTGQEGRVEVFWEISLREGMTMWRGTLAAAAGVLVWLAATGTAKADDVIRLGGPSTDAKTMTLGFDGQADTELMRGGRGVAVGPRG